jgi:hypothetical protein
MTHIRLIHSVAVWEKYNSQTLLLTFTVNSNSFIISISNTDYVWLLCSYLNQQPQQFLTNVNF